MAVIVELKSENRRIEVLRKSGSRKDLEWLMQDAAAIARVTMNDFADNFHYCPVYFFEDTNEHLVKERKFDDVLFNADGTPAMHTGLNSNSSDYLIAFYGHPVAQNYNESVVTDSEKYQMSSGEPPTLALVINDNEFRQLSYLYKFGYDNWAFKMKHDKKHYFISKHFEMEYFPMAGHFSEALHSDLWRKKHRIQIRHYGMFNNK